VVPGFLHLVSSRLSGGWVHLSGKWMALPPPTPLRTVLASFPAYGSSLSKALVWPGNDNLHRCLDDTRLQLAGASFTVGSVRTGPLRLIHQRTHTRSSGLRSFAFPPSQVLPALSSRKTRRKSAYPHHYRVAFAFSGIFCPHRHRPSLRSALPRERRRCGFTVFRVFDTTG